MRFLSEILLLLTAVVAATCLVQAQQAASEAQISENVDCETGVRYYGQVMTGMFVTNETACKHFCEVNYKDECIAWGFSTNNRYCYLLRHIEAVVDDETVVSCCSIYFPTCIGGTAAPLPPPETEPTASPSVKTAPVASEEPDVFYDAKFTGSLLATPYLITFDTCRDACNSKEYGNKCVGWTFTGWGAAARCYLFRSIRQLTDATGFISACANRNPHCVPASVNVNRLKRIT